MTTHRKQDQERRRRSPNPNPGPTLQPSRMIKVGAQDLRSGRVHEDHAVPSPRHEATAATGENLAHDLRARGRHSVRRDIPPSASPAPGPAARISCAPGGTYHAENCDLYLYMGLGRYENGKFHLIASLRHSADAIRIAEWTASFRHASRLLYEATDGRQPDWDTDLLQRLHGGCDRRPLAGGVDRPVGLAARRDRPTRRLRASVR